ncbi:MAG: hypothetical protein PF447_13580 [Spirochaetaceae bacterium]|jgi:hypothetical protein|nr:hypothetical protein [Spirochaetaceae bacterium]
MNEYPNQYQEYQPINFQSPVAQPYYVIIKGSSSIEQTMELKLLRKGTFEIGLEGEGFATNVITVMDVWYPGEILSYNDKVYFSFDVTAGESYEIFWSDKIFDSNLTADIKVSCQNDRFEEVFFTDVDDGYNTPKVITPDYTGVAILQIETRGSSDLHEGTFQLGIRQP